MTTIIKRAKRIIFWRAAGCYKSPLAILETVEDPNNGLHMKDGRPIFIRALAGSKYKPLENDLLINWGNGGLATFPELQDHYNKTKFKVVNKPTAVGIAANKIKAFQALEKANVCTVPWTIEGKVAYNWLKDKYTVIARTIVDGCCGVGIKVVDPLQGNLLPTAALYTRYVKKTHEYRVHVFNGKVIDITQKKLTKGKDPKGGIIRNVDDGWKFSHVLTHTPADLAQLGIDAVKACGLDFGAVDIIWNKHYNKCYVLEINTAPGLELRKTIDAYVKAILEVAK